MKVLRVISDFNLKSGGPVEGALRIDAALKAIDVYVDVITLHECQDDDVLASYSGQVTSIFPSLGTYSLNFKFIPHLRRIIKSYDALILDGLWQFHTFASAKIAKEYNLPYYVFSHGMLDPWFNRQYPIKHLKKYLYWMLFERNVVNNAASIFFTCEEERQLARGSFPGYDANESIVSFGAASPPSDPETLKNAFFQDFELLRHKKFFLFMSRIHEKKGCDVLIEAFASIANNTDFEGVDLVIAGSGSANLIESLKLIAQRFNISHRIHWVGMLKGYQKWGAIHACDLFCLVSHQENFGVVVAEATACGKPVLISNKVNIWKEIDNSKAGIIVDDTPVSAVTGLKLWNNMSIAEKDEMSICARIAFESHFQIDSVARNIKIVLSRDSIKKLER